ncbi:hypothetical protein [Streptomyces sp. NBC_00670]|jgi:hypothetical protein|uniref:hypothetical protein n=1 Tax=Streptomyces sp. NBC_00670 TaxID=2975804 RepID=UPI002E380962|nr:hypothetical protein [Streptomyces sp. NBC_00670]
MNPQRTPDPSLRAGSAPDPSLGALGLPIPDDLSGGLGHDAVGTTPEHGRRIMDCLPRIGCVFADDRQWWWVVPTGSQIGVAWPSSTRYAVGAALAGQRDPGRPAPAGPPLPGPAGRVRLIHRPDHDSPYTPPIPLYFLTCRLAGITPQWSLAAVG